MIRSKDKKQFHFLHYMCRMQLCVTLLCAALASCTDDTFNNETLWQGDGGTAEVTLSAKPLIVHAHTRTMLSDEDASKINDLYVLAFDASTGERVNVLHYYHDQDCFTDQPPFDESPGDNHERRGEVKMTFPTGTLWIVGVANVKAGVLVQEGEQSLFEQLEQVTKWSNNDNKSDKTAFNNLQGFLRHPGAINRLSPALTMSGTYSENAKHDSSKPIKHPKNVEIHRNTTRLPGALHLRRLDSYVKFIVKNRTERADADSTVTCQSFTVNDWQVINVPDGCDLLEQDGWDNFASYHNSNVDTYLQDEYSKHSKPGDPAYDATYGKGSVSFDFYMMENRKIPKKRPRNYNEREQEHLHDGTQLHDSITNPENKTNSMQRCWEYAPQSATYVVFHADIVLTVKKKDGSSYDRLIQAKYTVHLGNTYEPGQTKPDIADFVTERNIQYTYTVSIYGADAMIVEAINEGDTDFENGQEGTVLDTKGGTVIECDAHYNVFNLSFTPQEIRNLTLQITSPLEGTQNHGLLGGGENPLRLTSNDYQALRIAETDNAATLVDFSDTYDVVAFSDAANVEKATPLIAEDGKHRVRLWDIQSFLEEFDHPKYHTKEEMNKVHYFTFFLNEYVYHNTSEKGYRWTNYVNQAPRTWTIYSDLDISTDGDSKYLEAKYIIRQKSIQTFYNGGTYAMGLEYSNEYREKKTFRKNLGANTNIGYNNTKDYLLNNAASVGATSQCLWTEYCSTSQQIYNYTVFAAQPRTADYFGISGVTGRLNNFTDQQTDNDIYDIFAATLCRNRDLNRDGVVTANELRWFLPTTNEYGDFVLGRAALTSPLFKPSDFEAKYGYSNDGGGNDNMRIYHNSRYHLWGSDRKYLFSEEGYSTGDFKPADGSTFAWDMRCARYLGVDNPQEVGTIVIPSTYSNYVFTINQVNDKCRREAVVGALAVHHCFDNTLNIPAHSFRIAREPFYINLNKDVDMTEYPMAEYFTSYSKLEHAMHNNEFCKNYTEEEGGTDKGKWRLPNMSELRIMYTDPVTKKMLQDQVPLKTKPSVGSGNGSWRYMACTTWYPEYISKYMWNGNTDLSEGYKGWAYLMSIDALNIKMNHPNFLFLNGNNHGSLQHMLVWPVRDVD